MNDRAPDIGKAFSTVEKKLGTNFKSEFDDYINEYFELKI